MSSALIRTFLRAPVLAIILAGVIAVWGWRSFEENPKDAIPDIAENQVIVFSEWMGRSPRDVDEQVTYPLTTALQGVPMVRELRATSGFGWSIVYVIFRDDADFYWARSRVLERLNLAQARLPEGVIPTLGPDATGLGQIFWYTVENGWYSPERPGLRFEADGRLTAASRAKLLEAEPGLRETLEAAEPFRCPVTGVPLRMSSLSLDELRSIQDFDVQLALEAVEGVSDVAGIGGYVRQYQIDANPESMRAFGVSLGDLVSAVKASNVDVGAKVIERNGMELLVRGVGFLGGGDRSSGARAERERAAIRDIENIVVKAADGTPIYVRQLATVTTGPDFRRGALDKNGAEAVGGCVIMRYGESPLRVIEGVKVKIAQIEPGLPAGVRIDAFYDRTQLIGETMATLGEALWEELVISVVFVLLFLLHVRSSLTVAVTLPLSVLFAFICMQALGLASNIMSLAGIAIAIGEMVDMAIIVTENVYQHLTDRRSEYARAVTDDAGRVREVVDGEKRAAIVSEAAEEVGPAIVTAVSTTVVSFLPVFFLEGQAAKLFTPLAWTKTFCMVGAVLLALTITPPLAALMLRERRFSWPVTIVGGLVAGGIVGAAWYWAGENWALLEPIAAGMAAWLHVTPAVSAAIVGAVAAGLTMIVMRERLRPIEQNPTSRLIHWLYEPSLRWLLHHKALFLAFTGALTLWGIAIWLGWSAVLTPLSAPLVAVGVDPMQWTLGGMIHVAIALVVGLVIVPLIVETVRVYLQARRGGFPCDSRTWRWGRRIGAWATVVLVALVLNATDFAARSDLLARLLADRLETGPTDHRLETGATGEGATVNAKTGAAAFRPLGYLAAQSRGIGQEFMPPLDEGDFLYMPSALPAASINTVMDIMRTQDIRIAQVPEVHRVVGKLGRIDSALDPAPVGMLETVVQLHPREDWPLIEDPRFPGRQRRRTPDEVWAEIQAAGRYPGVLPSVQLQPIRTRVEMLSTGLNAKIGLKIYGDSIERTEALAVRVEQLLRERLVGGEAINAVRASGKPYLEIRIDREAIARYGVNIRDVQDVIEVALGGMNLTTTYEGLDRYPVRIRYQRELRDDVPDIERILVPTPAGAQIPLVQVAEIDSVVGPMGVRREGARFVSYVTMNNVGVDETTLVQRGRAILDQAIIDGTLDLPEGYSLRWTGSYERNLRAKKRLMLLIPMVLAINFILIYLQFRRVPLTLVIFLAIPVAFAGGFILLEFWPAIQDQLYLWNLMDRPFQADAMYLTVAVWVGFIALFGLAVDDGIVLATYLDQVFTKKRVRRYEDIEERVVEAGLRRIRPCLMTTFTTLVALLPVLLTTGRGSDVMVPMALPVFGGMAVALITLFVVPVCYCGLKQLKWTWRLPDRDFDRGDERVREPS